MAEEEGDAAAASRARSRGEVTVLPTPEAVSAAAAEQFAMAARAAIAGPRGRFVVALAGGSTPRALYARLASADLASRIDWSRVHVLWGDERCLPPDDAASNYRMARETLLDRVPIPPGQVHRMHGEDDPGVAAEAYERTLRALAASGPGDVFLDLVLLGMGDNGHTASLFPGLAAVRESNRWVVAEFVPEVAMWRMTLTPVAINAAARVSFLVTGSGKAAMLARVLEGPRIPDTLPAQAIAPAPGRLSWLVDQAAAAQLASSTDSGVG